MDLKTLARLARSRFPGAYDDIDDDTLGAAYAKKHSIPVDTSAPAREMGVMSGIKSLGTGVKETVIPAEEASDILAGPAYALRHPIDSAKLLFGAAQDASQDQFEKMYAAPTKTEAFARAVSGAVPFLGPGAATSGERIGEFGAGNTDEGMRGIGNALGILLGGKAAEKGAGLVRRAVAPRVTAPPPLSGAGSSLDPSAMPGVPMMASEAAGHRTGGGILAKALESSIPGAAPFENFRRWQQDALIGLGEQTTGRMSQPGADLSPYSIGDTLKQALQNATDDMRKGLHRGYAKLNKEMKGTLVDLAPVKDVIAQRLAEMKNPILPKKQAELKALKLVNGGEAALSKTGLVGPDGTPATIEAPVQQGVPFIDARKFRTEIREGRHPIHPDFVEPVVNATTEALRNAAQGKGQLARMERLDKGWAMWERTFNKDGSTIVKMRDTIPREKVHTEIVGASLDDISTIKNAVGPESFRDVKARLLQDIIEEAMSGELDTSPGGGVANKVRGANDALNNLMVERSPRRVSGKRVRNILEDKNRFGEDRLRSIFDGPKEYEAVMHFANTAEKVGASPSSLVGAFINAGLISEVMSGTGKALYGDMAGAIGNFAEAGAMYAGVNIGSRMMTGQLNPKRLLSRVVSKPGGAKAMSNYIEALSKKNGQLPESIRFRVPDKTARGKAYFWGRIVGKMAKDEAERMEKDGGNE